MILRGVQEHPSRAGWNKRRTAEPIPPTTFPDLYCLSVRCLDLEGDRSLPFIDKEGSLFHYTSDVGINTYLYSHGAFLWSLEKHIPDVALMIFHHDEVTWTSVYKFHDWSMDSGGSLPTTDYKSPQVPVQDTS
ncbi:hypothetical protein ACLB2K_019271 [Fragaria x ananassa]